MKYFLKIAPICLFLALGCRESGRIPEQLSAPEEMQKHLEVFSKRIEKVGSNIYVAIGYGLANSILIEGRDSAIIIDAMESIEAGRAVKAAFDSISKKPLAAMIYTHFHTDHTSGATALAEGHQPQVIAQNLLPFYLDQTVSVVRPITEKRAYRMFGVFLDSSEHIHCGIGPKLRIKKGSEIGVLRPTLTFQDSLHLTIAGIKMALYHVPGETPDHLMVWLPDEKILLCGDNLYKTFPNLYTIRGTQYRDVNLWKNSLDKMRWLRPEIIIPSHTEVIYGADSAYEILTAYRDAIQFIHDQTVRGMNQGLTPEDMIATLRLPAHLANHDWLKEYYGKTSWSVHNVFNGYMGFFDGNPARLQPLDKKTRARKMESLAGGKKELAEQISKAAEAGEFQWALELSDFFLALYPDDQNVIKHRIGALLALGEKESNPNARNYYLTCALELKGFKNEPLIQPTPELVKDIPISAILNAMATFLNPEKSSQVKKRVLFQFTDTGQEWMMEVRNGVAEVQPFKFGEPEITIKVKEAVWKELAAKIRKPLSTFLSGEIEIDGGQIAFLSFMRLFDIAD